MAGLNLGIKGCPSTRSFVRSRVSSRLRKTPELPSVLLSKYFGIDQAALDQARLIDPFIDIDTELFVDPVLLEKSSYDIIKKEALEAFKKHFENFIRLLAISEKEFDPALGSGPRRLLDLTEPPPENGLGYGSTGRSGSSRPEEVHP